MRYAHTEKEERVGHKCARHTAVGAASPFVVPVETAPSHSVSPVVGLGSAWPLPHPRGLPAVSTDDIHLVECIGRGTYGTVFTAWVRGVCGPDTPAAVKIAGLHDSPEERLRAGVRFSHEAYSMWLAATAARADAGAAGHSHSPGNVAAVHGCLFAPPEEGLTVPVGLLLEHCTGGDLFDVLSVSLTLTNPRHFAPSGRVASRLRIGVQLCSGVAAYAAAGLVHNDVKPENLFLRRSAADVDAIAHPDDTAHPDDVALGDAGAARAIAQPLEGGTAAIVGTLPYTAPEVAAAAVGGVCVAAAPAADVYSAGITLLLLVVKMFPWQLPGADTRRWVVQGEVVDNLALHAVPSDPTLLTVLLWMTDSDPAARPSAVTVRCIFAWLQADLWTHGQLCPARLLHHWGMPPHPKLPLFPVQVEPAVGPQAGTAPGEVMWQQGLPASMHDAHALSLGPLALSHSHSMEWPQVHSLSPDGSLASACADDVDDVCTAGDLALRARSCQELGEAGAMPPLDSPFFSPPCSAHLSGLPFREDSSVLVPVADDGPHHRSQPVSMLRTSYADGMAHGKGSAQFVATPGLSSPGCSRRTLVLGSETLMSGPLTSLHQAFPSCCGPPSAQTSIMSRAADALPEDEESPQDGLCAVSSDCRSVPEELPLEHTLWHGGRSERETFRDSPRALSGPVPVPGAGDAGNLQSCCDAGMCAGALLGVMCGDGLVQHTAHKQRRVAHMAGLFGQG